jgi:hypothetical protein
MSMPDETTASVAGSNSASMPAHANVVARPVARSLEMQSSALLADAQRLHRPEREIQALTASNTAIAALASQLRGLGTKPDEAAKSDSLIVEMKKQAADMARSETTALERAGKLLWRDMEQRPRNIAAPNAATAIAGAAEAKTKLDDAIAAARQAKDEIGSLSATKQALAAYDGFTAAYAAAAQFYISARRSELAALDTAAHRICDKLIALGKVSEPFFLASHARKAAYRTLVENAAAAQTQVARLDEIDRGAVAANSLRKVSGALIQASTIKATLDGLLENSTAAYGVYSQ